MFCKNCGTEMNENQAICLNCGIKKNNGNSFCSNCGSEINPNQSVCLKCGVAIPNHPSPEAPSHFTENLPVRNKFVAALLAIFLGGLGVHKFYLNKPGMGVLYLLFCWTFIPGIIGFIEGILYLCSSDIEFQSKHHVRLDNH
ncbi:hypothetical protein C5Q96_04650 [Mogibacterium diversum]|uniref:TM2 domain-containing protein n=1 Tax=Mogibacterium diversum TaxID=114527 RepID=A0A2S0L4H4_9FIRM|nr:TM2 domain-containing protein [Mogibacterium diversum]AVM48169.1 hypothetical protein C5Q96_04650 [Mogibacterium diversum]